MRIAAAFALFLLSACGQQSAETKADPAQAEPIEVSIGDELPGLSAPATGIAFWTHPNVAFNSLMIVANADGLVSYNIEDGNEVSRVPDLNAQGASVSYIGFGPFAAGVVATFDAEENAFRFYGVDNESRAFLPLEGGPAMRGNVRDFCFGRALTSTDPALFVVQKGVVTIYNFSLAAFELDAPGIVTVSESALDAPDDIDLCAVDADGVLLLATENGAIYRVAAENSFTTPFARNAVRDAGALALLAAAAPEGPDPAVPGWIALLDAADGTIRLFDRRTGDPAGAVRIAAGEETEPAEPAHVMAATGANLGGLYRNGAIALGSGGTASVIRLIPFNGVQNALDLPETAPLDPRGKAPEREKDDQLIIPVELVSE